MDAPRGVNAGRAARALRVAALALAAASGALAAPVEDAAVGAGTPLPDGEQPVQGQQPPAGPRPGTWRVLQERPGGLLGAVPVAAVAAADGSALRVYREEDGRVIGVLSLGPGIAALSTCPTLLIDERPPEALATAEGECVLGTRSASFELGTVIEGALVSPLTLGLMNGKRLAFLVRLHPGLYRELGFSLRGSKQALIVAIGNPRVSE